MRIRPLCLLAIPFWIVAGCTAPQAPRVVTDPDPEGKIPAIKIAVQDKDFSNAKQMVIDLDNDDPAIRFYALEGLRRLTGNDFGYHYYDDEVDRAPAIGRWQTWLKAQGG